MIKPIIAVCSVFAVYAILTSYNGVPIDHDHALMFIIAHDESVNDANNYAGITQKKWEIWRSKQGDIRHLPRYVRELAGNPTLNPLKDPKVDITIIKRYYYDTLQRRWHAWDIHPALQLIYADFVTLVGREAVKEVQKLVGVEADGQWGWAPPVRLERSMPTLKQNVLRTQTTHGRYSSNLMPKNVPFSNRSQNRIQRNTPVTSKSGSNARMP